MIDHRKLLMLVIAISLVGVLALFLYSATIEPMTVSIDEIDEGLVGNIVKTEGTITFAKTHSDNSLSIELTNVTTESAITVYLPKNVYGSWEGGNLTPGTHIGVQGEVALFGAEVVKVTGTYDQTKQIAAEFATRRGLQLDRGAGHLPSRESMKTIAYEIIEQLGWCAPDWYIQAVSGGLGPLGVFHGFQELYHMGLIDKIPKIAVIQSAGCAPMVEAFKAGKNTAEPVDPKTRIAILSTGDPGSTYTYLWEIIQHHGGVMESVSDTEAFSTMRALAKADGLAVEPATAVAFAGFESRPIESLQPW